MLRHHHHYQRRWQRRRPEKTLVTSKQVIASMNANTIEITLKLFAVYQEALGVEEKTLAVPMGTTAGAVCDRLIADHPELAQWKNLTRFGINHQFVEANTALNAGDELVLIPPVSGG